MKNVRETQSLLLMKHAWESLDKEICTLFCQNLLRACLPTKTVCGNTVLAMNDNSESVNQCVPSIAGHC